MITTKTNPPAAQSPPATVTGAVVFTDIVSFTEFTAIEGDEAANTLLTAQEEIVNDVLPADARLVKELGDGLMLWFPDAESALEICLTLLKRFEDYSSSTLQPLWVRMGIHWGRQTQRRDDLIGHDVNLAARIADQAGPSELLLSDDTVRQINQPTSNFEEIGLVVMKGIPEPVRLFRATPD